MKKKNNVLKTPYYVKILGRYYDEKDVYPTVIAKYFGYQVSHVNKIIHAFVEKDIVRISREGRVNKLQFTNKGIEIGKACRILSKEIQ